MSGKSPTVSEARWMQLLGLLDCVCCARLGRPNPMQERHHILDGGRRVGHAVTIPLCRDCHSIPGGPKAFERRYKFTELDLLNDTIGLVMGLIRDGR